MISECTLSLAEFEKRFKITFLRGYAFSRKENRFYMLVDLEENTADDDSQDDDLSSMPYETSVSLYFDGVGSYRSNRYRKVKVADEIDDVCFGDDGSVEFCCRSSKLEEQVIFKSELFDELYPDAPSSYFYEIAFKSRLKRITIEEVY